MKSGFPVQLEVHSESGKWFFLRLMPYLNIEKKVDGIVVTLNDISQVKDTKHLKNTLRELAEARVQLSHAEQEKIDLVQEFTRQEKIYQKVRNEIPYVQLLVDHRGICSSMTKGKQAFIALKADSLGTKELHLTELLSGQLATPIQQSIPAVISSKKKQVMEIPVKEVDTQAQVRCTIIPEKGHDCLVLLQNISAEKIAQTKLNRLEELVRLVVQNIPDCSLLLYNSEKKVMMTGGQYFPKKVDSKSTNQVFQSSIRKQLGETFSLTLAGERSVREVRYKGEIFLYHFFPVSGENDIPYAGMIVIQKITDIKKVKRDLEARIADLEQFAYAVSHDLKTPLRSIVGFAQLLQNRYASQMDDRAKEFIEFIVNNTMRMNELIIDILNYSTLDRENEPVKEVETKLIVDQLTETIKHSMPDHHVQIEVGELPNITANPAHMQQLFQNLIENGLKFNDKDHKRIEISANRQDGFWIFSVRDNGIGIQASYHTRIFSIFQHLNDRKKYKGNGIGLALCKRITEKMNGDIWVESVPEEGSVFHIKVPIKPFKA